jgi:hypothetical protein
MFIFAKLKEKEIWPKTRRELLLLLAASAFATLAQETFNFGIKVLIGGIRERKREKKEE